MSFYRFVRQMLMAYPNCWTLNCCHRYLARRRPTAVNRTVSDGHTAKTSVEGKKKTWGVRGAAAPRLNPSRGFLGGLCPPQPNTGGYRGQRPQPKSKKIRKKSKSFLNLSFLGGYRKSNHSDTPLSCELVSSKNPHPQL